MFEDVHFQIFGTMLMLLGSVIVLMRDAIRKARKWREEERSSAPSQYAALKMVFLNPTHGPKLRGVTRTFPFDEYLEYRLLGTLQRMVHIPTPILLVTLMFAVCLRPFFSVAQYAAVTFFSCIGLALFLTAAATTWHLHHVVHMLTPADDGRPPFRSSAATAAG